MRSRLAPATSDRSATVAMSGSGLAVFGIVAPVVEFVFGSVVDSVVVVGVVLVPLAGAAVGDIWLCDGVVVPDWDGSLDCATANVAVIRASAARSGERMRFMARSFAKGSMAVIPVAAVSRPGRLKPLHQHLEHSL
jgi:hypothetical protein